MKKKVIVIGSGVAGLSAACFLARDGYEATIIEKNDQPGGRARLLEANGYKFDMGPSWYWMPDVFERFFNQFDKAPSDYYNLVRLDPSYRIYFEKNEALDLPADQNELMQLFETIESGAGHKLEKFLVEAEFKYKAGMQDLVYRPGLSWKEFVDFKLLQGIVKLHIFHSIHRHVRSYFHDPRLIRLLEFPVLFLGARPSNTPALYSLMNYADMKLGTWYPMGGMHSVIRGITRLAKSLGVKFQMNEEVQAIEVRHGHARYVTTNHGSYPCDFVIGGGDYHHIEQHLLPPESRQYTEDYWNSRKMAPSALMFFLGLEKKVNNFLHHTLFFDQPFDQHAKEIYVDPRWPERPLFYTNSTSITDVDTAPAGNECMTILIPLAPGLKTDSKEIRDSYLEMVLDRIRNITGEDLRNYINYVKSYSLSDFKKDYHSFKGNAYGLANTLRQTAILRPAIRSRKVDNLFYAGQLTLPGPGVPPSLISGQLAAETLKNSQ